eukprot:7306972-Alexandrium_andersonii.AAC.1
MDATRARHAPLLTLRCADACKAAVQIRDMPGDAGLRASLVHAKVHAMGLYGGRWGMLPRTACVHCVELVRRP